MGAKNSSATNAPRTAPAGPPPDPANGHGATATGKPGGAPPPNEAAPDAAKAAPERTDSTAPQITSLVSKFLELADAGVGLGINVVSLLTTFATSRAAGAAATFSQQAAPPPPEMPQQAQSAGAATPPVAPARSYCIVNRLPLHAGSPAKVSFSINNDTTETTKNLNLACSGFVGAAQGFAISEGAFSVEPPMATIGPMDFERFVLKGQVPEGAPPDSYNGWITVAGDEELRIPAVLMVS